MLKPLIIIAVLVSFLGSGARLASASPIPQPMRDAVDNYAVAYAEYQETWTYLDRDANVKGDYRRARFMLVFQDGASKEFPWFWNIEARVDRCSKGVYSVSTPYDQHSCPAKLPKW